MRSHTLPPAEEMYEAFVQRDAAYDGIFFTGVKTTGIFCFPSCPARKPNRANVTFFRSAREAMFDGYRPCKRCRPMQNPSQTPAAIGSLIDELAMTPGLRLRDRDLVSRGLDPVQIRRWFKKQHDMTFHAYQRALRLGPALREIADGKSVTESALESGWESLSGFEDAVRNMTGASARTAGRTTTVVSLLRVDTPLGPMLGGTVEDKVCLLEFTDRSMLEAQLARLNKRLNATFVPGITEAGRLLADEVQAYFAGRLKTFSVPLRLEGTPFQEEVWRVLLNIPYGATRSYAEQANAIGRPAAVRAVARANGENRIAIIIPCHRVIGSNGALTGYGGGVWRKRWLLEHEQEHVWEEDPLVGFHPAKGG